MRTGILLAAAAAVTLALTVAGPSAEAQGGPMMSPMASPKKAPVAKGYLPRSAAKAKGPGRCGTNMYWKAGKCVDARK